MEDLVLVLVDAPPAFVRISHWEIVIDVSLSSSPMVGDDGSHFGMTRGDTLVQLSCTGQSDLCDRHGRQCCYRIQPAQAAERSSLGRQAQATLPAAGPAPWWHCSQVPMDPCHQRHAVTYAL